MKIVVNDAKATTLTELSGMSMAEMSGVSIPDAANARPMIL